MSDQSQVSESTSNARRLGALVNHDSVTVRFVSLWSLCFALFLAAWTVSYLLLPEGLLRRSGGPGPLSTTADSVATEFLSIFARNIGFCLVVVAANTFRSIRTPLGYLVVLVTWVQGAVVWGTDSLAIQTGRLAPSLSVVLNRSGVYELTALVAIAVATRGVTVWHQASGPRWREEFERVRGPREWTIERREILVLVAGLALLALANYREALMIVAAAS
ncbi:hypothetical protein SAMN04488063_3153 [Halopelagius inordinatus]|uniref:Uncharacterized protein n=1 Tax=Halopelagius inordinatus TaxID=553467 RepID=A0A1I2VCC4_9EURY|nr:hypothetical protein [Halopelagius inordinatus]SFG86733.1 hypothetical protein SAMN04488063_3153 [Halopelagius inordinatus]